MPVGAKHIDTTEVGDDQLPPFLRKQTSTKDNSGGTLPPFLQKKETQVQPAEFKSTVDFSNTLGMLSHPDQNPNSASEQATREANERIANEIQNSDKAIGSLLTKQNIADFQKQFDQYRRNDAKGPDPRLDFSFTKAKRDEQAAALKQTLSQDPEFARKVLEEQGNINPERKGQIQADVYQLDRGVTSPKIAGNVEKIKKGELEYNPRIKALQKPEGFWASLGTSYNERVKARNDYDFFQSATPQEAINKLETDYKSYDPDEPANTARGIGHLGKMIGGQPPQALLAGAAISLVPGAEEAAPWGAALVASPEIHAVSYANGLKSHYTEFRDQGMTAEDAFQHAQKAADLNANIDLAQGALMTAAGTRLGLKPLQGGLSEGFLSAVKKGTQQALKGVAKEAIPQGLLGAGFQGVKNLADGKPLGEGMTEAGVQTAATVAALGLILKAPEVLAKTPKLYNQIKQGLSKDPATTNVEIAHMVSEGNITPEEANKVSDIIQQHTEVDNQIPSHIEDDDTRIQIQDLIKHKTKLESDLEVLNKAYHPAIKQKIADIDEEIQKLSDLPVKEKSATEAPKPKATEGQKKLVGMPEEISPRIELSTKTEDNGNETKEADQAGGQAEVLNTPTGTVTQGPVPVLEQATTLLNKRIEDGKTSDVYKEMADHPQHLIDFINDQIKGGHEKALREDFGDDLVDLAKKQPITIKPEDNAIPIGQPAPLGAHGNGPEGTGGQSESSGVGSSVERAQPAGESNAQEAGQGAGEEKVISTKNAVADALRDQHGLPPVKIPDDRTADASLAAWKDGTRHPLEIVDQLLSDKNIYDKAITPNDEPIMREYIRGLNNRGIELNKVNEALSEKIKAGDIEAIPEQASVKQQLLNHYDEMQRALDAERIGGNIWHKYGEERQIAVNEQGQIINSINRIKTIYGDDMPQEMKDRLTGMQQQYDALVAKNAKIEEALKQKEAENELLKQNQANKGKGKSKKSSGDFAKERKDIVADMKAALKKARGNTYATIPGTPELAAIAPHVLKLFRSFGEQGIDKLAEMVDRIHDVAKEALDGITKEHIRDIIAGKYNEKKPLSELNKKLNDLRSQAKIQTKIEDLENGISIAQKKNGEGSPELQKLKAELVEAKKQSLNEYAHLSAEQLKKEAEAIQRQINKGDYFKMPVVKKRWENDPEWIKNDRRKADLKQELRNLVQKAYDSKKSKYMRGLDWTNRWGRRVIFFGANAVYTKLSSAAVLGSFVHRPLEQGLGIMNKRLYPNIARNAPIEGNINAAAEAKFYLEFLNPKKFAQNIWSQARYGETPLSKELGRHSNEKHIPIVDLFAADAHAMIKDPVKRATFEAAVMNHLKYYADNNIDGTHPLMLESARQAAYKTAEYEIFQNSNSKGKGISHFFNELEKTGIVNNNMPDTGNKIKGNAQYTAASLYHFFVPINTVPSNILNRVGLGLRTPLTMVKAMNNNKAIRDGILNMTHEESDLIMRQLKKGQVGTAYWTLGFILGGSAVGGLFTKYDPDKERNGPLTNELLIKGYNVPKDVQHNTQLQSLQMGGTWKTVYDHYIDDKGASQMKALAAATAATGGAALESVPTAEMAAKVYEAAKTPGGGQKFIEDLKRRVGIGKATNLAKLMGYQSSEATDAEKLQEKEQQKTHNKLIEWQHKLKVTDKKFLPADIQYDHATPKPNDAETKELNSIIDDSRKKLFKAVEKELDWDKMSDAEKKVALETVMKEGEETGKEAFKTKYPQFTPKRPEMTDAEREKQQEQSEKERDIQRKIANKARELNKQ